MRWGAHSLVLILALSSNAFAKPMPAPEDAGAPSGTSPLPSASTSSDIANEAEFVTLSKELGRERFTKFIVELRSGAITFFDVNVFRLHSDFVFAKIYRQPKTPQLNRRYNRNYGTKKPEFLLGYLSHHLQSDNWTFAFWEGDTVDAAHVKTAYAKLRSSVYFADRLRFRPDSPWQERVALQLKDVPTIGNDELYEAGSYMVLSKGTAVGTLRILANQNEEEVEELSSGDIVLVRGAVGEIAPVAGIVSEQFSTPLSRLNLQAQKWGIPYVGVKDAFERYASLTGKSVYLRSDETGFVLRESTSEEEQQAHNRNKIARSSTQELTNDNAVRALRPVRSLRRSDASAYGIRATLLGEISSQLAPASIAPGFVVPFRFYNEHMKDGEIRQMVAGFNGDSAVSADRTDRRKTLKRLRQRIIAAPLDPQLLSEAQLRIKELFGDRPFLIRSSNNAEITPEFQGIGELGLPHEVRETDDLAKAIKAVWADAWMAGALSQRESLGIDLRNFSTALIFQEVIDPEVSGTLKTTHLYDPSDRTTITLQASPGSRQRTENSQERDELLLYDVKNKGIRIITHHSTETSKKHAKSVRGSKALTAAPDLLVTPSRAALLGVVAQDLKQLFSHWPALIVDWSFRGNELFIEGITVEDSTSHPALELSPPL